MPTIIYWVRSDGPSGKDRVPMFYKGTWQRDCADGLAGDIRVRPVSLGDGAFTCTVGADACECEDGSPFRNEVRA